MNQPTPAPRFRILFVALLLFGSGVAGSFLGRAYGSALSTTPAWVGPVILIGIADADRDGLAAAPGSHQGLARGAGRRAVARRHFTCQVRVVPKQDRRRQPAVSW